MPETAIGKRSTRRVEIRSSRDDFETSDGRATGPRSCNTAGLPGGAPPTTQAAVMMISSSVSESSGASSPKPLMAPQGGIERDRTCSLIATAQGRTSSYEVSGIRDSEE